MDLLRVSVLFLVLLLVLLLSHPPSLLYLRCQVHCRLYLITIRNSLSSLGYDNHLKLLPEFYMEDAELLSEPHTQSGLP